MNKRFVFLLAGIVCIAGAARADSTFIDPALTDQNTYCWDSTFNAWVYCSPIDWGNNSDPNAGGGGPPQQCPAAKDLGTCLQGCDCEYEQHKSTCGNDRGCLDAAVSQQKQCYERCSVDWP